MRGFVVWQFSKPRVPIHFLFYIFSWEAKERKIKVFLGSVCIWTPNFAIVSACSLILLEKIISLTSLGLKVEAIALMLQVQLSHIFPHRYFCLIAHWFHCSLLSVWICCEKSFSWRLNILSFQAASLPRAVWNTGIVGRISPSLRLDLVAPVSEALAVAREATWAPLSHVCPFSLPFAGPCWHPSSAIPLGDAHNHQVVEFPSFFLFFFLPQGECFCVRQRAGLQRRRLLRSSPRVCAKDIFEPDAGGRVGSNPTVQELNPC